eukprot:TRINITY_DN27198_c0_g1_i1.p1 TRINITY_DN27198_c0_g1~~TRINITY_DN27198_c0_g1_i1.p1  ORF type:complete len:365 (-),score=78.99 TRINITY_DN27198_c0_g1_i1:12-1067(-)
MAPSRGLGLGLRAVVSFNDVDITPARGQYPKVKIEEEDDYKYDTDSVKRHKPRRDFLEFVEIPKWLKYSDITSTEWLGWKNNCSKNVTRKKAPFWHPFFVFKAGVSVVKVQLSKDGDTLWEAIYSGPPGAGNEVTNEHVPTGGKKPLFPEFCPPINPTDRWQLHIEHLPDLNDGQVPAFVEDLTLKPKALPEVEQVGGPRPPGQEVRQLKEYSLTETGGMAVPENDEDDVDGVDSVDRKSPQELAVEQYKENMVRQSHMRDGLKDQMEMEEAAMPVGALVAAAVATPLLGSSRFFSCWNVGGAAGAAGFVDDSAGRGSPSSAEDKHVRARKPQARRRRQTSQTCRASASFL